jgi:hypothetical protein
LWTGGTTVRHCNILYDRIRRRRGRSGKILKDFDFRDKIPSPFE